MYKIEMIFVMTIPDTMSRRVEVVVVVVVDDVTGNNTFETHSSSFFLLLKRFQRLPTLLFHLTHAGTK